MEMDLEDGEVGVDCVGAVPSIPGPPAAAPLRPYVRVAPDTVKETLLAEVRAVVSPFAPAEAEHQFGGPHCRPSTLTCRLRAPFEVTDADIPRLFALFARPIDKSPGSAVQSGFLKLRLIAEWRESSAWCFGLLLRLTEGQKYSFEHLQLLRARVIAALHASPWEVEEDSLSWSALPSHYTGGRRLGR
jgi:hypothetical protein